MCCILNSVPNDILMIIQFTQKYSQNMQLPIDYALKSTVFVFIGTFLNRFDFDYDFYDGVSYGIVCPSDFFF